MRTQFVVQCVPMCGVINSVFTASVRHSAEVRHAWESWTINTLVMALFGGADQDEGDLEMWLAELPSGEITLW